MERKKILLVEDEENERILYKEELEREGFIVICCENGSHAIKLIEKDDFDLLVLDIKMPQMDGIETLGKILTKKRNIPIIIYTAYPQYKEQFLTWAADEYIIKSADLTNLKEKVKSVLNKK
ncbi:MAG: response regulator [Candidatus Omnitrophica bacterium]|nr:response regulator [Candidatus Omnitrophota bacterium]MCM8810143.1 response regulator [Candidatus Omnitrophota bacterium]